MSRRKDAKIALLQSRQQELKTLVQDGRMEEAMDSAQKWGLDVDAVLEAVGQEPDPTPPPTPEPAVESISLPTPPPTPPPTPEPLWPDVTDAAVFSHPLNKRLYTIKLDDGRRANLWRMGAIFPVGVGVRVKLVETVGDQAYYEPIAS